MKKSLVALAALAAVGAASAQSTVTLSGKVRFAYESVNSTASGVVTKTSGLRVTDGDVAFTAVEDLGAGLKATAFINVLTRGRDTTISGRDAYISLAGGFGTVTIGAVEVGNGILPLGGAGSPNYGLDNVVIAAAANADMLRYTSPTFGGFNFSLSKLDATTAGGAQSASTTPDYAVAGLAYANGPIAAALDFTNGSRNASATTVMDDRTRVSGSYDFGIAKLGAGFESRETFAGVKTKDTLVGVSVPVGAVTFGLQYATSKTDGQVKVKGYDMGVKYDLSKRTYLAAHYVDVKNVNLVTSGTPTVGAGNKGDKFRLQLAHSF